SPATAERRNAEHFSLRRCAVAGENYYLAAAIIAWAACWTRGVMMSSPADLALPLYCCAKVEVVAPGRSRRTSSVISSFALIFSATVAATIVLVATAAAVLEPYPTLLATFPAALFMKLPKPPPPFLCETFAKTR